MGSTVTAKPTLAWPPHGPARPIVARAALLLCVAAALAAAFLATGGESDAVAQAGPDLTRLLRAMAAIKALAAAAAIAAVLWRLGSPATLPWLAGYALAGAAMAAGPLLVWSLAHVALGALLLHGGLLATLLLLWRDPAVAARLAALVATRRTRLRRALGEL
jgi:hypothetical protein